MPDKHLFEYAVIRIVPRVEREEFVNVGVILYCPRPPYLDIRTELNESRILALAPNADLDELRAALESFNRIARAEKSSGPIGRMDPASRFRWLTAIRSTIIQTSRVHPGLCGTPGSTLERMFEQMVR
jgi:hypothetical protein